MVIAETERLLLRTFSISDADLLYQYSQEESAKAELPDEVLVDREHAVKLIQMYNEKYPSDYPLVYAITLKDNQMLIGHISLSLISEGTEIGYAIAENYQRRGYAQEAIAIFSSWAKKHMELTKLYGLAKAANTASWHVLEKSGYTFVEEQIRKAWGKEFTFRIYTF